MTNLLQENIEIENPNAQIAHLVFCRHTGKLKKNQKSNFSPTLWTEKRKINSKLRD
jgi:hypothetical protein